MPQFNYRGRDKEGHLRVGQRAAASADALNVELVKEGTFPIQITEIHSRRTFITKLQDWVQGENLHLEELAIFSRQMQLLHDAGVPLVTSLKQLSTNTRSKKLAFALNGIIAELEKGLNLAAAMQQYPEVFSPLMISIVQIGENTGQLSQSFAHLHHYLDFELRNNKQIKSAFRYPILILISITIAILVLNFFVIPNFAKFYVNLQVSLPWETRLLINMSNFFINQSIFLLIFIAFIGTLIYRYLKTPQGHYQWNKLQLNLPFMGKLLRRIILIRFSESLSIILSSGISITQGLVLVKNVISNSYIAEQISQMQESIERGVSFTRAIAKSNLFTSLEMQILTVGEKNGELSPALDYIANFHSHEIEYDLKRINDFIGPVMVGLIGGLILIIALGVYLPIWNMINLVRSG